MAQARKRKKVEKEDNIKYTNLDQRLYEAGAIFLFALTGYLLMCLMTYSILDPGFTHISSSESIHNYGGKLGAWFSDVMYYFFGYLSFWIPICLSYGAYKSYTRKSTKLEPPKRFDIGVKAFGFIATLLSGAALADLHMHILSLEPLIMGPGGLLGKIFNHLFVNMFSPIGATLLLLAGFFIGVTLLTGLSWVQVLDYVGKKVLTQGANVKTRIIQYRDSRNNELIKRDTFTIKNKPDPFETDNYLKPAAKKEPVVSELSIPKKFNLQTLTDTLKPKLENKLDKIVTQPKNLAKAKQLSISTVSTGTAEGLPDVSLLEMPAAHTELGYTDQELHDLSRLVEHKLLDFGVEAQVVGVQPGPVVVRFELSLAPGIKVSKISGLAKDIARSLAIVSVRVVEVIPGKPYVGLEVPNTQREIVRLRELLEHPEYSKNKSPLTLVLGKDISGRIKLADLSKMPHLLVAGTTGSGKSVGVNAMLLSILFKATPKEVRLIMIDPKMLELSVYDGIPHLLAPVVTDMRDAANALKWCVAEMDRRYKLMAHLGVRNLASYNRKVEDAILNNEPILDPLWPADIDEKAPPLETLPFIVVVVDEFADMIMVVGRKVEELIARIAQKARAAGIHMILATQRPSVDVITGLIKANVPTRIAFQVSSKIDSRTILDQQGAEQLLGQGDMLYLPPGSGLPVRVHGAFVSDQEVHAVADDWRARQAPDYNEDITNSNFSMGVPGIPRLATDDYDSGSENDQLYDQAVQFVLETRKVSISSVQRRFKIGYNRAANIVEQMETAGIISPVGTRGGREILVPEGQGID